jgi:hypothetical protein
MMMTEGIMRSSSGRSETRGAGGVDLLLCRLTGQCLLFLVNVGWRQERVLVSEEGTARGSRGISLVFELNYESLSLEFYNWTAALWRNVGNVGRTVLLRYCVSCVWPETKELIRGGGGGAEETCSEM